MCLLFLTLWLAPRPAQAQGGGSWNGRPCDAQGNLIDQPHNNGFYVLTGTQNGTLSHTYPQPMINAALDYPGLYGDYLQAGQPLGIAPLGLPSVSVSFPFYPGSADTPNDRVGVYTPDFPLAFNYGGNGEGSYSVDAAHGGPSSGPINGSVTGDMSGTLLCYFHMYWSGPGPQPASASFLVSTYLYAQASVGYTGSQPPGGLSATATATDDVFNETASASAGDGSSGGGVPTVSGLHLVQAAVDPNTGVAEVYVNGTTHWALSNPVPYQTAGAAWAGGGSLVEAGAIPDDREVSITSPDIETSHYKGAIDADHPTGQWTHMRDATGAISTDSAVSPPLTQPGAPSGSWTASPGMLGQAGGFQNPVFAWSLTGEGSLSASGNTSHTQLSVQFPLSSTNTALNKQSTVRLDVTDSDGATGANTFAVKWHYPYENWQASGAQFQNSPLAYPSSNGPQAVNGQVSIPVSSADAGISWNIVGKVGGGFLTTGAATIAVAQPETDPIIIGALTAFGYTLSVLDPPPTPQPYSEPGTPGQFQSDVATQVAIDHGNTDGIFLPSRPRMDPGLAAMVNASGNYGSYTTDQGGSLTFDVTAYEEQIGQNYTGDGYDQHGYTGSAAASINRPGPWHYVWDWVWTGTSNPPAS